MKHLDDKSVLAGLRGELAKERVCIAEFLNYLSEVDARRLYAEEGYSSLFAFCSEGLGLSEGETFNRTVVARLLQKIPQVLDLLRDGKITLTAARLLAPHLTEENATRALTRAVGKSTREVEKIAAELSATSRPKALIHGAQQELLPAGPRDQSPPEPKAKPDKTRYVTPNLVEIRYSAKEAHLKKLERIEALARSRGVAGSLEEVMEHVFEAYLDSHDPARKATMVAARKPRSPKDSVPSRYIPKAVAYMVPPPETRRILRDSLA